MGDGGSIEEIRRTMERQVEAHYGRSQEQFSDMEVARARQELQRFQRSPAGKALSAMLGNDNPFEILNDQSTIEGKLGDRGTVSILDRGLDAANSNRMFTIYGPDGPTGVVGTFSSLNLVDGRSTQGFITQTMVVGSMSQHGLNVPFQLELVRR